MLVKRSDAIVDSFISNGGARILEQVGPAAGPKVV